jgi:hypothetical protein
VNNGIYVGTLSVDTHMHLDLRGRIELTVDLVAVCVDMDDHIGGKNSLGYARRSAVEVVRTYFYGNITVVSSNEALSVELVTNFAYFLFDFKN